MRDEAERHREFFHHGSGAGGGGGPDRAPAHHTPQGRRLAQPLPRGHGSPVMAAAMSGGEDQVSGPILALGLGLLAGQLRPVRNLVEPIVEVLRPIPPLALLPLFIVWVGIGETSKIAFITYATFFPVFLTTVHAVQQVDPLLLRAAASLGARRAQLFLRVVLPAALPEILTGIRLGVALAFFVIVISEFIGAEQGLGYLINDGRNFFLVPQMLGAAIVLGLLGYAGNALVMRLGRRWLRWETPAAS